MSIGVNTFLSVFPASYLNRVLKRPYDLQDNFVWLKVYPVSEFGFDICKPDDRLKIFQAFVAITKYVASGRARFGMWKPHVGVV